MINPPLTVAQFKTQFNRAFVYGVGFDTVQDADITNAINAAWIVWNPALWDTDEAPIVYGYATAHYLTLSVQAAGRLCAVPMGRGVNSHGGGVIQSKSVGQVSVNYQPPDLVTKDPILFQFMRTDFGQLFLMFLIPRLVGNVAVVSGQQQDPFDTGGGGHFFPLIITTTSLPNATHLVAYSQQVLSQGGVVPLTWTVYSGTLPSGLTLTSGGHLAGTPTAAGTYYFTFLLTDGAAETATQNYRLVVA